MFSPDVSITSHPHQLRSKRSRRQASDESIKLPQAKKRRSALRKDTFDPPQDETSKQETAPREHVPSQTNGFAPEERISINGTSTRPTELTLRGGKKSEKRSERGDGSFVLSSNDYYSVAQLPALPEIIRSHSSTPYSSVISSETGYALAITHTHAVVWLYNSNSTVPSAKDTFSFSLPFAIATNEPLPLAAFTNGSATKEPGLVVVTPTKGKIAYWETISSATSLLPSPQANGVQGSIPGLLSGESVMRIVSAEPAGFMLSLSHGRVAHLTLRDQLGRPAIGVQFLRRGSTAQGGIFGSLRGMLGNPGRKGHPAVHAGRSSRGQRDLMLVTNDAEIELWDIRHNAGDTMKFSLDAREKLLDHLRDRLPFNEQSNYRFSVLDFTYVSQSGNGDQLVKTDGESLEEILILASLNHNGRSNYYIVDVIVSPESARVCTVHPISCYKRMASVDAAWHPKIYVPRPGQMAFVVFESAIVLYSLARLRESPTSQLLLEGGASPEPFQDCIRFQDDTPFHVLSASSEDKDEYHKHPSIVTAVQSFGLVRITSTSEQTTEEDIDDGKITPKSKIEQAVFFGSLKNNPLDLVSKGEQQFDREEVESAALEISQEILTSSSKYLPKATPSIENNLRSRLKAHDELALHLSKYYDPLSRPARFQLLWNAEKLAAQRAVWKIEEQQRKRRSDGDSTVLQSILEYVHPDNKTAIDRTKGENDKIRHWMTFDADKVNKIVPWLYTVHSELYKDEVNSPKLVSENILDSIELLEAIFETAFKFREDNASLYGLEKETFRYGLLQTDYDGLPLPWTSSDWQRVSNFVTISNEFARKWWVIEGKATPEQPIPSTIRKIGASQPILTKILSRMILERAKWAGVQDTDSGKRDRDALLLTHRNATREQMLSMAGLGFFQDAISLAEEFADMEILVELNVDALGQIEDSDDERYEHEVQIVNERMDGYYGKYRDRWATAFYEKMIQDDQLGSLVNEEKHQDYLTAYLRRNPSYGKISWINDILGEKTFENAAETLALVAEEQETDLWSKKVELSLSKLATLAALESESKSKKADVVADDCQAARLAMTTSSIALLDLQNRLHLHVTSLIGRNVLDISSRLEIAFDILGKNSPAVKDRPAFKGLLFDGLSILLRQEAMTIDELIDVLTLMAPVSADRNQHDKITEETLDAGVIGNEFFFAFKAIDFALPSPQLHDNSETTLENRTKREALQTLVWRRVMLRDNWQDLNNTASKSDEAVTESMKESTLGTTIFQVMSENLDLTNTSATPRPNLSMIPSPDTILEAPTFPTILKSRFKPQEADLVSKDLEREIKELESAMEKGRLGLWFDGLVTEIQTDVVKEKDETILPEDGQEQPESGEVQDKDVEMNENTTSTPPGEEQPAPVNGAGGKKDKAKGKGNKKTAEVEERGGRRLRNRSVRFKDGE